MLSPIQPAWPALCLLWPGLTIPLSSAHIGTLWPSSPANPTTLTTTTAVSASSVTTLPQIQSLFEDPQGDETEDVIISHNDRDSEVEDLVERISFTAFDQSVELDEVKPTFVTRSGVMEFPNNDPKVKRRDEPENDIDGGLDDYEDENYDEDECEDQDTESSTTTTAYPSHSGVQCGKGCFGDGGINAGPACGASPPVSERDPNTVSKRKLTTPEEYDEGARGLIADQFEKSERLFMEAITTSSFRSLGKKTYNLIQTGLYGCTGILVVSRKAVWMAHIWEHGGFQSKKPDDMSWEEFSDHANAFTSLPMFDSIVINPLIIGSEHAQGLGHFIGANGDWFSKQYNPQVLFVTPKDMGYPKVDQDGTMKIGRIASALRRLVPDAKFRKFTYDRTAGNGAFLFRYNPVENWFLHPSGCYLQQAALDVWGNTQQIYYESFPALPEQMLLLDDFKRKRDGRDSCPLNIAATASQPSTHSTVGLSPLSEPTSAT